MTGPFFRILGAAEAGMVAHIRELEAQLASAQARIVQLEGDQVRLLKANEQVTSELEDCRERERQANERADLEARRVALAQALHAASEKRAAGLEAVIVAAKCDCSAIARAFRCPTCGHWIITPDGIPITGIPCPECKSSITHETKEPCLRCSLLRDHSGALAAHNEQLINQMTAAEIVKLRDDIEGWKLASAITHREKDALYQSAVARVGELVAVLDTISSATCLIVTDHRDLLAKALGDHKAHLDALLAKARREGAAEYLLAWAADCRKAAQSASYAKADILHHASVYEERAAKLHAGAVEAERG